MNDTTTHRPFTLDTTRRQFLLDWNDHIAWVDYEVRPNAQSQDVWYLIHAEVPAALRGQGVGQVLVEKTYAYLREHGIQSVPVCTYIQALVKRNPELVTGVKQ